MTAVYNAKQEESDHFLEQNAAAWAQKIQNLDSLISSRQRIKERIDIAQADHEGLIQKCAEAKARAEAQSWVLVQGKEAQKTPLQQQYEARAMQLRLQETEHNDQIEASYQSQRNAISSQWSEVKQLIGQLTQQTKSPDVDKALEEALGASRELLSELNRAVAMQLGEKARHATDAKDAQRAAQEAEQKLQTAERKQREVAVALEVAQDILTPKDGSLLAALRSSEDAGWKDGLSKVLDARLLSKTNLSPSYSAQDLASFYGWNLDTSHIAQPAWADDGLARQSVEEAMQRLEYAKQHVVDMRAEHVQESENRRKQVEALSACEAQCNVLTGKVELQQANVERAQQAIRHARQQAQKVASDELYRQKAESQRLQDSLGQMDEAKRFNILANRDRYAGLISQAKATADQAALAIDEQVQRLKQALAEALDELETQKQEQLEAAGVNVTKLRQMQDEYQQLESQVNELESKQSLVRQWQLWNDKSGPSQLEELKEQLSAAASLAKSQTQMLEAHQQVMRAEKNAFDKQYQELDVQRKKATEDAETLSKLLPLFGDYMGTRDAFIDPLTPVHTLTQQAHETQERMVSLEVDIRRNYQSLMQRLTVKESTVKELIDKSMLACDGRDLIGEAHTLCIAYKEIGPQVVEDVNLMLDVLLQNVAQLHKSIRAFESGVGKFNAKLQLGLKGVKVFERIQELQLHYKTNFDDLGFYKKLTQMESLHRERVLHVGRDSRRDIPAMEFVRALGDFRSVLGVDGRVEINLAQHIAVQGRVTANHTTKEFKKSEELSSISSDGLTTLILVTLMTALVNTIRGTDPVYVPWVTDEVGKFDAPNFRALLSSLANNQIDVLTASPELGVVQKGMFARRYLFEDKGRVREYATGQAQRLPQWQELVV